MKDNLFELKDLFNKFLNELEKEIYSKDFLKALENTQKIDSNHYKKIISVDTLKNIINDYREYENFEKNFKKVLILLPGNPEIVFRLGIEAVMKNLDLIIGIEDFCFAQNTILIEAINNVIEKIRFKNKVKFKNLINDLDIIENSKLVEKIIIIGNSNLYNRLQNKIDVTLNSYGIFDVYSDSEEFDELQEMIFEIFTQNEFEVEFYDDLEFDDAIRIINKQSYKFCSILFTNDKNKTKEFKEKIDSEYVIVNQNPFKEIKFKLEIE